MNLRHLPNNTHNNWVIIKPDRGEHEHRMPSGQVVYIDVRFDREKHVPVSGIVMACPKEFWFEKDNVESPEWKTTIEIKNGDHVYYHYLSALNALNPDYCRLVYVDEDMFFLVKYDSLFLVKEETVLRPLNGLVLIEPVYEKQRFSNEEVANTRLGKVRYVGSNLLDYSMRDMSTIYQPDVKPGDIVVLDKACNATIEYDFHASLEGTKLFYRVEKRFILGVL